LGTINDARSRVSYDSGKGIGMIWKNMYRGQDFDAEISWSGGGGCGTADGSARMGDANDVDDKARSEVEGW